MVNRAEVIKSPRHVLDDTLFTLGNDNDVALVLKSGILNANTALTGVAIGTPVAQALPVNSAILSNTTADGDILMLVNDGGNSKEFLLANGDTADLQLGHGMATATIKTASGDLTLSPGGSLRISDDTFTAATKHLVVGHTATVTGTHAATFEVLGTGLGSAQANIGVWSADPYGPAVTFIKSRHASIGSNAIVEDNDLVGRMIFLPDDGTDFATRAAQFHAEVDDASAETGYVGMAFVWSQMLAGTQAEMRETMRLDTNGALSLSGESGSGLLNVGASGSDWTSTGITVDGSSNSTIQRSNTSTSSNVATMRIKADTSNDMSDGYGAQLIWTNRDSADVNNDVGYMVFQMAGADNTSDFILATRITGSANEAFKVSSTGVGSFDLAGDGNGAPSLFDRYDDATELQRFAYASEGVEDVVPEVTEEQRLANRERMVEMGIFEEVPGASSGYHMRIQPLMNLLAGGIYQNRHRMDSQYEQLNKRLEAIGA